jgi:SAM-dependent methyltransferase
VYRQLSSEYYDQARHPTSRNLRAASLIAIRGLIVGARLRRVCEFGAGRSIFLDLPELQDHVSDIVLVDESADMLRYSDGLPNARRVVADVGNVELETDYFDCIIASLGDAYNLQAVWERASSLLSPGGWLIYTGPALPWATRFRRENQDGRLNQADFDAVTGRVSVPSYVLSQQEQFTLWRSSNLVPLRWVEIYPADVPPPLSPKILDDNDSFCAGAAASKKRSCF